MEVLKRNYDEIVAEAMEEYSESEIAEAMGCIPDIRVPEMAGGIYRPNSEMCKGFEELTGKSLRTEMEDV